MKTFKVYNHPTYGLEAIKVGFSWPAFFFSWLWALVRRVWYWGAILFAISVGLRLLEVVVDDVSDSGKQTLGYLIIWIGYATLHLVFGFKGNNWRESVLIDRGYEQLSAVQSKTKDAAVAEVAKGVQNQRKSGS